MQYDLEQVMAHLELLTGEKNPITSFQIYHDEKGKKAPKGVARDFHGRFTDNLEYFNQIQALNCGIYVSVNQTDGLGRKEENIVRNRFFVADWDGKTPPPFTLKPTFICKRADDNVHAYWKIKGECDNEKYKEVQFKTAVFYDSDIQIRNPAQVLRLCGSVHLKVPSDPQMYRITEINEGASYTAAEMLESMPFDDKQEALFEQYMKNKDGNENGTGFERSDRYEKLLVKWAKTIAPVAVQGGQEAGTLTLIKVALWARDRGILLKICQDTLWEHYNQRCLPVWEEDEKWHFYEVIQRAYEGATSAIGCKTVLAVFGERPPLPPRTDGWVDRDEPIPIGIEKLKLPEIHPEENAVRGFERISREEAERMRGALTSKTPDYDLARFFDGIFYDGKEIYRSGKVYYVFNGKTYDEVDDAVVKSNIQKTLYEIKPVNSKVKSILESHCDLCNMPKLENGTWIDGSGRCGTDISVYKNGLVDLSKKNLELESHTYRYFSFSKKEYEYNPNAKCPTWDKFMASIFETDMMRETLLLEFMGLLLIHGTKFQKFLFLLGVSRGGKGVISNIIRMMVGKENCANPSLEGISKDHILFSMHDKSVAIFNDVRSVSFNNREASLSTVLQITGEDAQTFNRKFKPPMTCKMPTRIIMTANIMPDFIDGSGALIARMLLIKFDKSFKGKEDLNLGSKLEEELSGISNRAIKAYREMVKRGSFTEPVSSIEEKEEIKDEMFPLSSFVNECCVKDENAVIKTNDLFKGYLLHCNMNGTKMNKTKVAFSKCLRNSDIPLKTFRRTIDGVKHACFSGITLNREFTESINMGNVSQFPNRSAEK